MALDDGFERHFHAVLTRDEFRRELICQEARLLAIARRIEDRS